MTINKDSNRYKILLIDNDKIQKNTRHFGHRSLLLLMTVITFVTEISSIFVKFIIVFY